MFKFPSQILFLLLVALLDTLRSRGSLGWLKLKLGSCERIFFSRVAWVAITLVHCTDENCCKVATFVWWTTYYHLLLSTQTSWTLKSKSHWCIFKCVFFLISLNVVRFKCSKKDLEDSWALLMTRWASICAGTGFYNHHPVTTTLILDSESE